MEYIEITDIKDLNIGDIIKHKSERKSYIVTANYGDRVTAVLTVDVTNPIEWEVLHKKEPNAPL